MRKALFAGTSLIVLALAGVGTVFAQQAEPPAFFRMGYGLAGSEAPPGGGGTNEDLALSYPDTPATANEEVSVSPVLNRPASSPSYSFYNEPPSEWGATIDEQTGVVTMTPTSGGTHHFDVVLYANDYVDTAYASFEIEVGSAYKIDVSPGTQPVQDGTAGFTRIFQALLQGTPSTTSGEEWFLTSGNSSFSSVQAEGPFATFDLSALATANGGPLGEGRNWFQFGRRDITGTVLSKPFFVDISPAPLMAYADYVNGTPSVGSNYRVDGFGREIQVLRGQPVNIPAVKYNGAAVHADPQDMPSWLRNFMADDIPPAGLQFAANGDIFGTATASVGAYSVNAYTATAASPPAYGGLSVTINVVDALVDPAPPEEPEEPVDPTPPATDENGNGIPDIFEDPAHDLDADGLRNDEDDDKDGDGIPDADEANPSDVYSPNETYWWGEGNPTHGPVLTPQLAEAGAFEIWGPVGPPACEEVSIYARTGSWLEDEETGMITFTYSFGPGYALC